MSRIATVSLELEEFRLIAAARGGDKLAYARLVRRNQVAVFHAAYLLTGSAVQAQTLALQAFVQAWPTLRRLPVTVSFGAWVLSIAARGARAVPHAGARRATPRRMREQAREVIELESRLVAARTSVELPPAPDLSGAVLGTLGDLPRRCGRLVSVAAAVTAVAGLLATLVLVGPALRRSPARYETGAAALTPLAGAERFPLGRRIPLAAVRHAAGFTALMPPTPSEAYLGRDVPGGRVSMFAGRVLITEFRGVVFPYILTLIGPGAHAQLTWVNGSPGVYGSSVHARAPGDVLTWLHGPLTLRIEGANTLEQALALARTLR